LRPLSWHLRKRISNQFGSLAMNAIKMADIAYDWTISLYSRRSIFIVGRHIFYPFFWILRTRKCRST
jgi:hypothetical protein